MEGTACSPTIQDFYPGKVAGMEISTDLYPNSATNLAARTGTSFLNAGPQFTHLLNGGSTNDNYYNTNEALTWCVISIVKTKHSSDNLRSSLGLALPP